MWAWLLGIAASWGILVYFILAMMGAGSADNLRGRRLKLFLACLFWPVTLVVVAAVIIFNLLRPKKKRVSPFGLILGGPSGPNKQAYFLGGA
jgi:hypothetical protein